MKIYKLAIALLGMLYLSSCASGYKTINPENLSYNSKKVAKNGISLEYKYDLLPKKYAKKEKNNDVRLVAIGLTNNTDRQLVFGRDFQITYEDGSKVLLLEKEKTFEQLKQQGAFHLFYLLLTPTNIYSTTSHNGYTESQSVFPIGLILGPGLAGYNILKASSSNKKFKKDLENYDLNRMKLNPGEEKFGIIGIRANSYDALRVNYIGNTDIEEEKEITK